MLCKLCLSANVAQLPFAVPADRGTWVRCGECGSDSNSVDYDEIKHIYNPANSAKAVDITGGAEKRREQVSSNCDWFEHHRDKRLPKDFLDIGCLEGSVLDVMQCAHGWSVHGFDVFNSPDHGGHITVNSFFSEWLFPQKYAAVMCREVFEHVPAPNLFLHQCFYATMPHGLFQVQTPIPLDHYNEMVYQVLHLFLVSPKQLRKMLGEAMFDILDERHWDIGQAFLCRARG